jgi:hypothetical protein
MSQNHDMVREYLSRVDEEIQGVKKTLISKADGERVARVEKHLAEMQLVAEKHYGKNRN